MSGITIHMIVPGAARAVEWYRDVFGAEEQGRITLTDGRLIHVEVRIGDSTTMLADEFPEHEALAPAIGAASSFALYLSFPDVDTVWRRAIDAGAEVYRALADTSFGERDGQILDPFGYRWGLTQHLRDVSPDEMRRAAVAMFEG